MHALKHQKIHEVEHWSPVKKTFCQLGRMLGVILGYSIPSTAAASGLEFVHPIESALPIVIVRIFIRLVGGIYQPRMRSHFVMTSD